MLTTNVSAGKDLDTQLNITETENGDLFVEIFIAPKRKVNIRVTEEKNFGDQFDIDLSKMIKHRINYYKKHGKLPEIVGVTDD